MQSAIQSTCCSIETIMLLSTDGLPGPGDREQVREAGDARGRGRCAGRRAHSSRSVTAVAPADVDRAAARRSSRRSRWRTRWRRARTRRPRVRMPVGVISSIGVVAEVDERDVVAVERLEVVGVDAEALGAERVVARAQRLGDRRVARRSRGSWRGRTRRRCRWRRWSTSRSVNGREEPEAAPLPARLVASRSRSSVGRPSSADCVARRRAARPTQRLARPARRSRVVGLRRCRSSSGSSGALRAGTLKFGVRWKTVRCAACSAIDRDRLDARRAGADDADALAGEVDALVRPARRCGTTSPCEARRGPGSSGILRRRQAAGRHDAGTAPSTRSPPSVSTVQRPAASSKRRRGRRACRTGCRGAGRSGRRRGRGSAGSPAAPGSARVHSHSCCELVGERVGVVEALDVAARARVAVPVPGAADAVARLEARARESPSSRRRWSM